MLVVALPARADQFLLGFTGFDYHVALPASTHYLDVGDSYYSLGFVTSVDPGLLGGHFDFSANEYTYALTGATVEVTYYSGSLLESDFASTPGARTRFYEDALAGGTPAVYGTLPPNPTAPSSFTDGAVALGGRTYNFIVTYDFTLGQGSFSGSIDFDEGSDLAFIPVGQRTGWAFGGVSQNAIVPAGYDHQIVGQCQVPAVTPARHVTWGAIKRMYH
jgi:hypothetical protein